ncbi:unnamed protein product [Sphenostylis stenocarpa]|uniref:Uncharacterized protein n=1 Tax=Sphenostylis stenocarpa TaxID=92480 RepID=A0AA86VDX4_9FABA|nr:unnamed protein product [Sphenostylis stenocarpa]
MEDMFEDVLKELLNKLVFLYEWNYALEMRIDVSDYLNVEMENENTVKNKSSDNTDPAPQHHHNK